VARAMLDLVAAGVVEDPQITFITSVSSEFASINRGEYCVSKAGLSMVVQLFAARLAEQGIRVYEVRPGIVATDMTAGVRTAYDARISSGLVPIRRWGTPADVGRAVASLASGAFPFSTGEVVHVDGGLHVRRL
jgi:NAD(P)-dependent dehydrogenase (short-subunit alcohol dehydrogenase family)